jgi:multiple sugar transport system permease protein
VPKELEEAARIDGASRLQTMRRDFPAIVYTAVHLCWNLCLHPVTKRGFLCADFSDQASVRTGLVGVIAELIRGDVFYWGPVDGGCTLDSIPVAIIYSFFVEHYVAGLTSGSVKG